MLMNREGNSSCFRNSYNLNTEDLTTESRRDSNQKARKQLKELE